MGLTKLDRRNRIRKRIRKVINGSAATPRMSVYRSNKEIYAQLINDIDGKTIAAASSKDIKGTKIEQAGAVGKAIAEKSIAAGVSKVVFDRGGYLYHGRVKALAEGARESGLKF